ncbi:hypothetical protein AVEN_9993-1 [Araneus ventricosus]|uniref:BTB domain-containing protein n=1 Tax=Araneus ventricosus TaxID=182803 RepID=A0A4Y2MCT2_ARAVE|nr:hypothetical protein AVEN_97449-1 [Araneus ventricosus]GBN24915.1 hypothetical protein AVEN_9993-1 [Araneus ventricosus]
MAFFSHFPDHCFFRWNIYNPFVPWQPLEATFYYGFPNVTRWKVTLKPLDRGINCWQYAFSLKFDGWSNHGDGIVAENVLVFVVLGDDLISSPEVPNYHFCRRNRFRYEFQEKVVMHPQENPHRLGIIIDLLLPFRARRDAERNDVPSLRSLSADMRNLLTDPSYYNMILWSTDHDQSFRVHYYIIEARWSNFFRRHPANFNVDTDISDILLWDILTYMYSGVLGMHWPDWTDEIYTTELFQVMERYKLYHLYKVLVKSDLEQLRETRHPGLIESRLFPLDVVVGRPINSASRTWTLYLNSDNEVVFRIGVWNEAGNWLSYSVQSKCPSTVHVEVNLKLEKKVGGSAVEGAFHFHGRACTLDPDETVDSGPVLFLGCPETFGDSHGTEVEHSIRCYLNVVSGEKAERVQSVGDDSLQDESERFGVLSDHLQKLHEERWNADVRILSRPDRIIIMEPSHRGIFVARLPEWWKGLVNVPVEIPMPDMVEIHVPRSVRTTLGRDALPILLEYMYTGKVSHIPRHLAPEISEFAIETGFLSFHFAVERILRWRNR